MQLTRGGVKAPGMASQKRHGKRHAKVTGGEGMRISTGGVKGNIYHLATGAADSGGSRRCVENLPKHGKMAMKKRVFKKWQKINTLLLLKKLRCCEKMKKKKGTFLGQSGKRAKC